MYSSQVPIKVRLLRIFVATNSAAPIESALRVVLVSDVTLEVRFDALVFTVRTLFLAFHVILAHVTLERDGCFEDSVAEVTLQIMIHMFPVDVISKLRFRNETSMTLFTEEALLVRVSLLVRL